MVNFKVRNEGWFGALSNSVTPRVVDNRYISFPKIKIALIESFSCNFHFQNVVKYFKLQPKINGNPVRNFIGGLNFWFSVTSGRIPLGLEGGLTNEFTQEGCYCYGSGNWNR